MTGNSFSMSASGIGGSSAAAVFFQSVMLSPATWWHRLQPLCAARYTIEVMQATEPRVTPAPLTQLSEEERMFQSTVRKFARERIGPHVRAMDEAGVFRKDLLHECFELGLMGIDIPEEYGGQGGYFFQSILAIEELARVDPSAAVIVDVQNTLFNNAILRWATEEQKTKISAALDQGHAGELRVVRSRLRVRCLRACRPAPSMRATIIA